jgi:hypothetical protein
MESLSNTPVLTEEDKSDSQMRTTVENPLLVNKDNNYIRSGRLDRTKNQLKSLQELADYFFCYSWMYDKMATYTYYKNITMTISASTLSILIAQSIFSDLTCSEYYWVKILTASISYLSAFLAALIHFLALPATYKEYKDWAGVCINNYYEIQHWMIDAVHSKENYMQFSKRMTKEFVLLTKKSRPILLARRALIKEFANSNLHFPPIVGNIRNHNAAIDLHDVIDQITKKIEKDDADKAMYKLHVQNRKKLNASVNNDPDNPNNMYVVDISMDKQNTTPLGNRRKLSALIDTESDVDDDDDSASNSHFTAKEFTSTEKYRTRRIRTQSIITDPRVEYELSRLSV